MKRRLHICATLAMMVLSGCITSTTAPRTSEAPPARQASRAPTAIKSPASHNLARYYKRVQDSLLAQGLLRTDGGSDAGPLQPETVARNFARIALYEEYDSVAGRIVERQTPSRLHRWEKPVRADITFGGVIPREQKSSDRRAIENYFARLGRITDHPIDVVARDANFHVFVVDEDARRALGPRIRALVPSISPGTLDAVIDLPRSSYCLVLAYDPEDDGTYERAVAIIRSEHPDLLRLSCIHEELAQGLGLSNDSPQARPSVFNDDEEFGLLTPHDEELLRILYDPRLSPGMRASEAMPIVRQIAREHLGGSS